VLDRHGARVSLKPRLHANGAKVVLILEGGAKTPSGADYHAALKGPLSHVTAEAFLGSQFPVSTVLLISLLSLLRADIRL